MSPLRVVWNDWPALAGAVALPIIWVLYVGFPYLKPDALAIPLMMPWAASLGCCALIAWRLQRVHELFKYGELADGRVTALRLVKDRGRLEFEFDVDGVPVRCWTPVHKTRQVLRLRPGMRVPILFAPNRPGRAIVKSLYEA